VAARNVAAMKVPAGNVLMRNALVWNALVWNALARNALVWNDLVRNAAMETAAMNAAEKEMAMRHMAEMETTSYTLWYFEYSIYRHLRNRRCISESAYPEYWWSSHFLILTLTIFSGFYDSSITQPFPH
jgi:hypothetical protein